MHIAKYVQTLHVTAFAQPAKDEDRNYLAELLYQMYNDPVNKLYLAFL